MKTQQLLLAAAISASLTAPAFAQLSAAATFTDTLAAPGKHQYQLTLSNSGSTTARTGLPGSPAQAFSLLPRVMSPPLQAGPTM
ncbi:MAG TPA: hypothetical protein VK695_11375 [Steroidobacteraceae bacterium]|jgi:hypothetical protein|nr:hypothetical protein [Steroidobacteraceae bacterium]